MGCNYVSGCGEVEEYETGQATQYHADADREVLRDVIGIKDAERCHNSTKCLDDNGQNDNPIITSKKAVLGHRFAVQENNANEKGGKQGIDG